MKPLYERFFAYQLEKPSGFFGRFFMKRFLNRGNLRSNELALKHLLETRPDSVLEIGFGGGWLLGELLEAAQGARIAGVDHSPAMVAAARKGFGKRVELHCGAAEKLPFADGSFSHVCTVHTAYFWENPQRVVREIHRVLRGSGTAVISIHSKAKLETQSLTRHNFRLYEPKTLVELLAGNGFEPVTLHSYDPDAWEDNHCIVARRAP